MAIWRFWQFIYWTYRIKKNYLADIKLFLYWTIFKWNCSEKNSFKFDQLHSMQNWFVCNNFRNNFLNATMYYWKRPYEDALQNMDHLKHFWKRNIFNVVLKTLKIWMHHVGLHNVSLRRSRLFIATKINKITICNLKFFPNKWAPNFGIAMIFIEDTKIKNFCWANIF